MQKSVAISKSQLNGKIKIGILQEIEIKCKPDDSVEVSLSWYGFSCCGSGKGECSEPVEGGLSAKRYLDSLAREKVNSRMIIQGIKVR